MVIKSCMKNWVGKILVLAVLGSGTKVAALDPVDLMGLFEITTFREQ